LLREKLLCLNTLRAQLTSVYLSLFQGNIYISVFIPHHGFMVNVVMIGTGYVGLVTGTLFSDKGNMVVCVDKNKDVVDLLNKGKIHIFEPGLERLVSKNREDGRLVFTMDLGTAVKDSDIIFLGINTPLGSDGSFMLDHLFKAAKDVGVALRNCEGYKVIVCKSTVPQGTYAEIISIIREETKNNKNLEWDYVSNPETLAEGSAVKDFLKPDRIIIGTDSNRAFDLMEELYHPFNITQNRVLRGSPADAELAKLFSNTALATRIAMVNEFARVADVTPGADMDVIRRMVCDDTRIGHKFMFPSPGYGGSCFPKDIPGVVNQSKKNGYEPSLLNNINVSNEAHKSYLASKVINVLGEKKRVAIWGLTFKPNTDDMRESASIPIINKLLGAGYEVIAYDPRSEKAQEVFKDKIKIVESAYEAVKGVDALILLTEWPLFDSPDFNKLKSLMKGNYLFDFRNRWLAKVANRKGFNYVGVGRNYLL
jgi:UDPglucose 6-dehydrogenase